MDSTYSLQEMNGLLFNLFISSSISSSKNSNNSLLDDKTQVDPSSIIEEPSSIDIVEDSLLSSNKEETNKSMISIHSTSEMMSFSKSDISLKDKSYQSFLSITIPTLSTEDIEQIFNEESISNLTFSGNDLNESTNLDNIKELNDQISRRILRECLNLPEVLYACLQHCIFCSYYNNQSIFPILCADYKHFYQDYIHGNSNEDVTFYLISSNKLVISHEDLLFFLSSIIPLIPSFAFLLDNPSLFDIYITTAAYIIEFRIGQSQPYITKSQFKASHFLQSLYNIIEPSYDHSYDPYFCYEATYVLWTLFQHLDTDQDSLLSLNELRRYDDMSFIELALQRILMIKGHYDMEKKEYVLNYPEFIQLVIANESQRTKESIQYWFDILDLNMTGLIDESCVYSFYKSQKARLLEYSIEGPSYELYAASIYDLINCKGRSFSLSDLLPTDADLQVAVFQKSVAIDMMVNTVRFLKFEHRDPSRQNEFDYNNPVYCDWKSFVTYFYNQFAYEEEPSSQVD